MAKLRCGDWQLLKRIAPARGAGEQQRIISMKLCSKNVEVATHEQELTVVVHPDPSCYNIRS